MSKKKSGKEESLNRTQLNYNWRGGTVEWTAKFTGLEIRTTCFLLQTLLLTSCVALGKTLHFSGPACETINWNKTTYFLGSFENLMNT